ncbi:MAG TPA: NAD(P)-dependent oxidoreductase [Cyclobacteriaceae bacterium]|nr:NAD(P)-dependent oxidoreductase [Cyclobacteriaceae bacterium]
MKILITGGSGFIGTNLIEKLLTEGHYTILNIDCTKPYDAKHLPYWENCDLMNENQVNQAFQNFKPEAVVHLAARTDTDPKNTLDDYKLNTQGSTNLINAIKNCSNVKKVVFTSTQFVHQYKQLPKHDEDFAPHTVYGESKVIMEKNIRNADLMCIWTIIRPTNIWGPWHLRYPYEFWKVLSKGLYIHPGRVPVIRSYGYVGNVAFQIISILKSEHRKVDKKVFYVGDSPIDLYDWVNGFSVKQTGKKVRVVPRAFVKMLAWVGDVFALANVKFPITSSRYKSMTNSNSAPMEKTLMEFGNPPYSLEQGIEETVQWMKIHHPDLVRIK